MRPLKGKGLLLLPISLSHGQKHETHIMLCALCPTMSLLEFQDFFFFVSSSPIPLLACCKGVRALLLSSPSLISCSHSWHSPRWHPLWMGPLELGERKQLLDVKGLLENRNDNTVAVEVSVGLSLPRFNFYEQVLFLFWTISDLQFNRPYFCELKWDIFKW